MRSIIKNKRGGFTDLFLFMIIAFILVLVSGIFIYIGNETRAELREKIPNMDLAGDGNNNASVVLENTFGKSVVSLDALIWITVFLMIGMVIAIFIGSYMVTTKPIFFIPYIFIVIIAIVVSVGISNSYELLYGNETLGSTFAQFIGASWILAKLPIIVSVVGVVGGIIMFSRMGKKEEGYYR